MELERAQRNLARLQRIGDKHGELVAWQKIVLLDFGRFPGLHALDLELIWVGKWRTFSNWQGSPDMASHAFRNS